MYCPPSWWQADLIEDGLYLSGCEPEQNLQLLHQLGITHVLQVGAELTPTHAGTFRYHSIPIHDREFVNIVSTFPEAFAFIKQARQSGGRALVHCRAGVSRSATIIIAFLMLQHGLSAADAIAAVRKCRAVVLPNTGFLCQLLEFEQLACDAARFPGWGWQRWLDHPLAHAAHQLNAELLNLPVPLEQDGEAGGVAPGAAWLASGVAVNTVMPDSPFAQLAAAAPSEEHAASNCAT